MKESRNKTQKGFGKSRLRSSVCRQGRRLCPEEVKRSETLYFDKRNGWSKQILGNGIYQVVKRGISQSVHTNDAQMSK